MFPCRFPSYGKGCQLECNCKEELCNHISGCPNPATEKTTGNNSETYGVQSVPGEKKKHIIFRSPENYLAVDTKIPFAYAPSLRTQNISCV